MPLVPCRSMGGCLLPALSTHTRATPRQLLKYCRLRPALPVQRKVCAHSASAPAPAPAPHRGILAEARDAAVHPEPADAAGVDRPRGRVARRVGLLLAAACRRARRAGGGCGRSGRCKAEILLLPAAPRAGARTARILQYRDTTQLDENIAPRPSPWKMTVKPYSVPPGGPPCSSRRRLARAPYGACVAAATQLVTPPDGTWSRRPRASPACSLASNAGGRQTATVACNAARPGTASAAACC